jgi:D-serine/D-alanine/glycine transporter
MLFGLSKDGQAPNSFSRLSKSAVPANGLIFSCVFIMGGAVLQYFVPNTMEAFTLASSLCVILFISVWSLIMVCYIRYRKLRPELHEQSKFKMPGGVFMSYVVIAFLLFTLVILALEPDTLKALYVSPLWVVILAVTYQVLYKPRMRKLGRELA